MVAQISSRLNIVMPVETVAGRIFVHSTPIDRETFEMHWEPMAAAMARIFAMGLSVTAGPGVAALALRDQARKMGVWEGRGGVKEGLMPEIVRLSNVVMPGEPGAKGWVTAPLYDALQDKRIGVEEAREIEDILVFFTLVSSVNKRSQSTGILLQAGGLWGFQLSSLNSTEWAASLPTSTAGANSGEMAAA